MPLLTLSRASLAYGHFALLDAADLAIDPGEHIALIGRNGSGKSTLMQVLTGAAALDDGELWRQPGLRVGYVPQEPSLAEHGSVFDAVAAGLGAARDLIARYHEAAERFAHGDAAAADALHEAQVRLEQADAWRMNTRIEQVLEHVGLDGNARVDALSGGGVKRVALAQALVADPELLLLDEPTNHLDIDGIVWLESLIASHAGAVLVVTHDRRFLDRVATRIVELDRGRLRSYPGSFAAYQQRKADELAAEALANARFDKLLAQEEVWIRKGVEARRTRNEGRVRRLEQLRRERERRRETLGRAELAVERGEASGRLVAELAGVSKAFGERVVVKDFSARVLRGDKIGVIGPNGAGKTTLLRLILGELAPDAGRVRLGTRLAVAYFDQFRTQLDPEAPLTEVVSPGSEYIEVGGSRQHVIGYLGEFLFPPERARSPVKSLSGGERNRLLLARLFSRPANVLVLDEPTNDLDLETLDLLETLLQDYEGTVFLVSHDRAFLDNVVTQVIAAEGGGLWREYVGGCEDWLRQRATPLREDRARAKPAEAAPKDRERAKGLSWKESRELEALPDRIGGLEAEQQRLNAELADPALYKEGPQRARELQARLDALEAQLAQALGRWEELETRKG